ncbi:MAG: class I SAM-dependent methyltransferase [Bacteroidota bacterium]
MRQTAAQEPGTAQVPGTVGVPGTAGYGAVLDRFVVATEAVPFDVLHRAFLGVLPPPPSRVLDVGAGIGRDAAVMAKRGYSVVAVEPLATFREAGQQRSASADVTWVDDALPDLASFETVGSLDFVLASAVWHHLEPAAQDAALRRGAMLVRPGGVVALSLRHGPGGAGRHLHPTSGARMLDVARTCGLVPLVYEPDQPSLLPGKADVTWTRLAFAKR